MFLDALQQKIRIWPNKQTRWVETALLFLSSDCDLNTLSSFELLNYLLTTQTEKYNVSRQRMIVNVASSRTHMSCLLTKEDEL